MMNSCGSRGFTEEIRKETEEIIMKTSIFTHLLDFITR